MEAVHDRRAMKNTKSRPVTAVSSGGGYNFVGVNEPNKFVHDGIFGSKLHTVAPPPAPMPVCFVPLL